MTGQLVPRLQGACSDADSDSLLDLTDSPAAPAEYEVRALCLHVLRRRCPWAAGCMWARMWWQAAPLQRCRDWEKTSTGRTRWACSVLIVDRYKPGVHALCKELAPPACSFGPW